MPKGELVAVAVAMNEFHAACVAAGIVEVPCVAHDAKKTTFPPGR